MNNKIENRTRVMLEKKKTKKTFHKIVSILAAFTIAVTSLSLSRPGITMAGELICEKNEHEHTSECYETTENLTCTEEHEHTETCYTSETVLKCEQEVHVHSDSCYEVEEVVEEVQEEVTVEETENTEEPVEEQQPEEATTEVTEEQTVEETEQQPEETVEEEVVVEELEEEVEFAEATALSKFKVFSLRSAPVVMDEKEAEITSWQALQKFIDDAKDSAVLNITLKNDLAADSTINITGNKTVNLYGANGDKKYTIYRDASVDKLGSYFNVEGDGKFNVNDVVMSGKTVATAEACRWAPVLDKTASGVGQSGNSITIGGDDLMVNRTDKFSNPEDQQKLTLSTSNSTYIETVDLGNGMFMLRSKEQYDKNGKLLQEHRYLWGDNNGLRWRTINEINSALDGEKQLKLWYGEPTTGELSNRGQLAWLKEESHSKDGSSTVVYFHPRTDTFIYREPGTRNVSIQPTGEETCYPEVSGNVSDAPKELDGSNTSYSGTAGVFITSKGETTLNNSVLENAKIKAGTGLKDVAPVAVTSGTFNINKSQIKDNISTIPSLKNNNRKLLYNDVHNHAASKGDKVWDLNWGGQDYRLGHDDNSNHSAGGVLINGGTVNLNSGSIESNTGMAGAVYIKNGTLNQNGGTIDGNHSVKGGVVVDGSGSHYNLNAGNVENNDSALYGGGITAYNEGHVTVGQAGDGCSSKPNIINNKTLHQGGGIFVHSNNVNLISANISGNVAHFMGGGIYVVGGDSNASDNSILLLSSKTYITDNNAGNEYFSKGGFYDFYASGGNYGSGGGMWLCTYGSLVMDGEVIHMWGNSAHSDANDFYKHSKGSNQGVIAEFSTATTDKYVYHNDPSRKFEFPKQANGDPSPNFRPISGRIGLDNNANYDDKLGACNTVDITNNIAAYAGGGIGSNGILTYKPTNDTILYIPEFSFEKKWEYDGSQGVAVNTEGREARFIVKIYDLQSNDQNPYLVIGDDEDPNRQIIVSDTASKKADENGVYSDGFVIDKWKVSVNLPQLYDSDGKSIYHNFFGTNYNPSVDKDESGKAQGSYSIDDKIRVEIIEVTADGKPVSSTRLKLGELTYDKNTKELHNHQQDIKIVFNNLKLQTSLTNVIKDSKGRVILTKKDKASGDTITDPNNQPEFRISPVDENNQLTDKNGEVITGNGAGEFTTEYLAPGKYAIWESISPSGYDGIGADKYIYVTVDENGVPSIESDAETGYVIAGAVSNDQTGAAHIERNTVPVVVFNKKNTKLVIAKTDEYGNPVNSSATQFRISTFRHKNGEEHRTFELDKSGASNTWELSSEDVETWFGKLLMRDPGDSADLKDWNFLIEEITPPNNRYETLKTAIPFKLYKDDDTGKYIFYTMTRKQVLDTPFGTANGNDVIVNGKTVKYLSTDPNEKRVEGVTIHETEGSVTYTVENKLKPIEFKVAKVDENGRPLPGAVFSVRTAKRSISGKGASQIANNPDDGIYTFNNEGANAGFFGFNKDYSIWEDTAPEGYKALGLSVIIHIDKEGRVSLVSDVDELRKGNKYDLDGSPEKIAEAMSNGTITLQEDNKTGMVTITIKNYPKNSLDLLKIEDGKPTRKLAGAKFRIKKYDSKQAYESNPRNFSLIEATTADRLWTTDAQGELKIEDLKQGYYVMEEAKAPDAYQIALDPIKFTVDEEEKIDLEEGNQLIKEVSKDGTIHVGITFANIATTYELPNTGGEGTLAYTLGGSMMILLGALLLGKKYLSEVIANR